MSKVTTATSIMFEEIKEQLDQIQVQLNKSKVEEPKTDNLNEITQSLHSIIDAKANILECKFQRELSKQLISHVNAIELKLIKGCVIFVILVFCLFVSLCFNFL